MSGSAICPPQFTSKPVQEPSNPGRAVSTGDRSRPPTKPPPTRRVSRTVVAGVGRRSERCSEPPAALTDREHASRQQGSTTECSDQAFHKEVDQLGRSVLGRKSRRARPRDLVPLSAGALPRLALAPGRHSRQRRLTEQGDVVRRDEAERVLADNNERIESLFEYHPHAVYSLDLQGRFVDVNAACERLTGFSREDLRGMDSTGFSAPSDSEVARATLEDIAHRRARVFETTIHS